jgi:capsular exopolysaccharide synthesis family protein
VSKIYDALKRAERDRELSRGNEGGPRRFRAREAAREAGDQEEFQRLRASLLLAPAPTGAHTILVTATRHGEGATRVAIGLATALASERDSRVLLVEANLRSPSLLNRLPVNGGPGLCDVFAGRASVEEAVSSVTGSNLSFIHAGAKTAVVDCEALAGVLARLRSQYDFIVVDGPPVNGYADVPVLAPKTDGVILVVEADRTPVAEAETAKRSLDRVGARLFGVVLNRQRSYVPSFIQALL